MTRFLAGCLVLAFAAGAGFAQDEGKKKDQDKPKFDKTRHAWLKFKKGTWVKMGMTVSSEMGDQESERKKELKEVDDGYTLAITTESMGQEDETEEWESIPEFVKKDTVKIGEKEYKCTVWKSTSEKANDESEDLIWLDEKGRALKIKVDGDTDYEVTAVELDVEVEIDGKKYKCVKMKGTVESSQMEGKLVGWYTSEIPGGVARMEMEVELSGMSIEITMEVEEFEIKK